jgi:L-threonylcarbamoyladenylate synthase
MLNTQMGSDLKVAESFLAAGELVAIPTETVYGLAANALNEIAVAKIFEAKNRPTFDPLIVHIASIQDIFKYSENITDLAMQLAEKFMPGPLTLLVQKKSIIPHLVTSGLDTVGLRIPNHALTLKLLQQLSFPLAAPSANPFGYISPTTAEHVLAQLNGKLPYILNGGNCSVGVESTIVEATKNEIIVHRLGGVPVEDLKTVCANVVLNINQSSNPKAPGKLLIHYAPKKQLFFTDNLPAMLNQHEHKNVAVITFFNQQIDGATAFPLSINKNLNEAASNLFKTMRFLDQSEFDVIIAEAFPNKGLGLAINDRLTRASL